MANRCLIRTAMLVAAVAGCLLNPAPRVAAAELPGGAGDVRGPVIKVVASEAASQFVPLGIGKSVVIDFPRDIKDVLVADPKIANAVIRSTRRAYIIGGAVGQTSVSSSTRMVRRSADSTSPSPATLTACGQRSSRRCRR